MLRPHMRPGMRPFLAAPDRDRPVNLTFEVMDKICGVLGCHVGELFERMDKQ
ncbi:MAG: helix-turn-helix transcriptional regulator [Firmicutes bacterium]|nr:helix-turn-helix transcriptional regulator [Bacillota bacterium]